MKKWNLKEVAEILGVLGVIGSLVFVALEVQQNTAAVRSQASQGIQDQILAIHQLYVSDPTMTSILLRGRSDRASLTPEELVMYEGFWRVTFQAYQNLYIQVQENAYDRETVGGWWQSLQSYLEYPGIRQQWSSERYLFSPAFRTFVEADVMTRNDAPALRSVPASE